MIAAISKNYDDQICFKGGGFRKKRKQKTVSDFKREKNPQTSGSETRYYVLEGIVVFFLFASFT